MKPTASPWAARLQRDDASAVAFLRLAPGVRGCIVENQIWLHGDALNESIHDLLRHLAPVETFTVTDEAELVPLGHLLPVARLPQRPWQPIDQLISIEHSAAALCGSKQSSVRVQLIRDDREQPVTALLTDLTTWSTYARTAPAIRLRPLRFAASASRALVRGQPLPPLRGRRFYEKSGLIVPCGYTWSPRVDPPTLRRAMSLQPDDLAMFVEDGSWQLLTESCFVQARRSAIRLTVRGMSAEAAT